jgi:hypothetical protein
MMRLAAVCFGVLCFLVAAGPARSAALCPWVTQGSADTVLGGESVASVQVSESGEGVCSFTLDQGGTVSVLKVAVRKTLDSPCAAGSKQLKGIGNEAAICTRRPSHDEVVERIVSRVREKHFTVSISVSRKSAQQPEVGHHLEDGIKQIAETVAGNLF